MSISSAVSVLKHSSRVAVAVVGALGMLVAASRSSAAQTARSNTWELRFTTGALVPTGAQRNSLKDAPISAAQLSWAVRPSLAITGTFGWARSRDLSSIETPKLDVFTSDLGIEARPAEWFAGRAVSFSPFAGAGAGARSYNYRSLNVDATNNFAAYGAVGGELGIGRVGLRAEMRDYASGFKPLAGSGRSGTRNDVIMMLAVRFNRHRAPQD